ncbi:MAG: hypothetical protein JXO51_01015 [Candidatus Aminicenantes bacterium]|nr:hypothetical protein [Candidatus Aminicenantes bacterium]
MHFVVIAYDGTDEQAPERRAAVRPEHLQQAEKFHENGKWLYACGILNGKGGLIGSMIVCEFASREEMQREWLDHEPYVLGRVWEKIAIHPVQVPPFYLRQ